MTTEAEECMAGVIGALAKHDLQALTGFQALLGPGVDRSSDIWSRADWPTLLESDEATLRQVFGDRALSNHGSTGGP